MIFAGLDIETTGTDPNKNHRLIQIGIVFSGGSKIAYDVRPIGSVNIDAEAMFINHFTLERIVAATPQTEVDNRIAFQLTSEGYKENSITPVGWNVGGFDMGFVKKELPKTAAFFSYRTLDLTSLAIMHELRSGKSYRDLKVEFAADIAQKLGRDERHDALYDAEAALVAMQLFKEMGFELRARR
jgi:DNA polymerase III epsilon subunit-like protein